MCLLKSIDAWQSGGDLVVSQLKPAGIGNSPPARNVALSPEMALSVGSASDRMCRVSRPYARTNANEYFAEISCAYLDRCNRYPHTADELKELDPTGYKVMEKVWGKQENIAKARDKAEKDRHARLAMKKPAYSMRYCCRNSRLVSRTKLNPTKKNRVGGITSRNSCSSTEPILDHRLVSVASSVSVAI
jgi:hypothetical protein